MTEQSLPTDNRTFTLPPGRFRLAAVGDIIITVDFLPQMESDPNCRDLIELLNDADLVVGNFEGSIIDAERFEGYPAALSGFGWLIANPTVVPGLQALNLGMLSRANNHTTDWGRDGMDMTNRYLEDAGIVHAGTGSTRIESREARGLLINRTPIGMVSWTTEIVDDSTASNPGRGAAARPGASALRQHTVVSAGPEAHDFLRSVTETLGVGDPLGDLEIDGAPLIHLLGNLIELDPDMSPAHAVRVSQKWSVHDHRELFDGIRVGKDRFGFLIASQHHHRPFNNTTHVPEYSRELAREAVDEGVDFLFGHGPHRLRGVEVYRGVPIFHSLGNLFWTNNTQEVVVPDEWERYIWRVLNRNLPEDQRIVLDPAVTSEAEFLDWIRLRIFWSEHNFRSVVAMTEYQDGVLQEIVFHPIELFFQRDEDPDLWRGIPRLADVNIGREILEFLDDACRPLGTSVEIEEVVSPTGRTVRAVGRLRWAQP